MARTARRASGTAASRHATDRDHRRGDAVRDHRLVRLDSTTDALRMARFRPEPRRASDAYCSATLSSGDNKEMLSVEQALNAEIITRAAVKRSLPDHAATVAIATAMQETRLMNLSYGDRDSVGLFQQRPSQGWGTKEQLMDETYAANRFYDELVKVPNWQSVPVEDAAQSVQRSQYPDRYADWTNLARTWAAGLTGETGAGVACALEPAQLRTWTWMV